MKYRTDTHSNKAYRMGDRDVVCVAFARELEDEIAALKARLEALLAESKRVLKFLQCGSVDPYPMLHDDYINMVKTFRAAIAKAKAKGE